MKTGAALTAIFLAGMATQAVPQSIPRAGAGESCSSLPQCLARIRARDSRVMLVGSTVEQDIVQFGAAAVDALVPMLMDPDLDIRERAGMTLAAFPNIDPRHLPALVQAWRHGDTVNHQGQGNGWLPRAIAATGTDEALRLLWEDYERDPEQSRNSQTFFALAQRFSDRIRPLLVARIAACRDSAAADVHAGDYRGPCAGIYPLLQEFRPRYPAWSRTPILDLAEHARSDEVRAGAEMTLAWLSDPAALAPLQRRLAALSGRPLAENNGWSARLLIGRIEHYGPAARESGPAIAAFLSADQAPDLRADAALALGRIDARSAIPALLALAPDLADDWVLAYNVAESLGRLRAAEARPLLQRLADSYWHRGVRNNAARALSAMSGGPFANPALPGDGTAYPAPHGPDGEEYSYFGDLRFAGDDAARSCEATDNGRLIQDPVGRLRPPRRGAVALAIADVDAATGREFRRIVPQSFARGGVEFALPVNDGTLLGFNGGEFGGGLVLLPDSGSPRKLTGEPMAFAWRMGDRLFVAAGLNHLVLDTGHLYIVDPDGSRIVRTIRLPASPQRLFVAAGGLAVIGTAEGQIAIGADGQLVDVGRVEGCRGIE